MDADKIERILEEKKVYIKKVYHIREIGIFGSFIRGEQTTRLHRLSQTFSIKL